MLINDLPGEIISQILSNVSTTDEVHECIAVCKLWCKKLIPVHYRNARMQQNHERFLQHVQTKIPDSDDQFGDYVITLTFDTETKVPLSQENFELLIKSLPSLRAIRFNALAASVVIQYMEYLDRLASHTKLEEVSLDDYLRHFVNIEKVSQLYYSINDQLKYQIVTLNVVNANMEFKQKNNQEILEYVKEFRNLKHLTFDNTDAHMTSVLDAFSDNLRSLATRSTSLWDVSHYHEYHLSLTSLRLQLPKISGDHFCYLVEYVPNLKELTLDSEGPSGAQIADVFASLPPDMSCRFLCYLKQLRHFKFTARANGRSPNMDNFWGTIQKIYNGQPFCNLDITFRQYTHHKEEIYFDKQTFNVNCHFLKWEFHSLARHFHFLRLNSVSVRYHAIHSNDICMSDLLEFALSQQQVQAKLRMNEQAIYLSQMSGYVFPQDRSPIHHAFLEYVYLDSHLLDILGNYYPEIKDLRLFNCRIQKEDASMNHYTIDLQKFKRLQRFELTIATLGPLYFQCVEDGREKLYVYDRSISVSGIHPITDSISKDREMVTIITAVDLETFVFHTA